MASIAWTDDTGAATLTNAHAAIVAVAGRFANWAPRPRVVGDVAVAVGTGQRHRFAFRTDHGATFELRDIPQDSMALMDRLVRHLDGGGTITVNTGDAASHSYTCGLAPEAELPYPELTDPVLLWYAMRFSVISREATPAPLLCVY